MVHRNRRRGDDAHGPLIDTCGHTMKPPSSISAVNEVPRSIVSVQLMVRLAGEHGLAPALALTDSGITLDDLMNPQAEIRPQQELQVIDNLVRSLPQVTDLGLQAGRRYHLSLYGVWGFALATSPTPRAMAQIATRYLDLSFAFVRFALGQQAQRPMVEIQTDHLPAPVRRFALERDFAALVNVMEEILPGVPVFDAIDFRGAPPAHADAYTALCGLPPRFRQAHDRVYLRAEIFDLALPQGNALVSRACEDYCRRQLARKRGHLRLSEQIRDRLMREPQAMPDINTVARELHMAPRSLRRRLDAEGTRFRSLCDEVRRSLAEDLLRSTDLKLEEVAQRLGYAEAASFIHAFRRWTGMTPSQFRSRATTNGRA